MNKNFLKKLAGDLVYSIAGLVAMNGVMQFLISPYMSKNLSAVEGDNFLFFMAIIGLMGSSLGTGTNYARMTISTKRESTNGDYNWFLLFSMVVGIVVTAIGMKIRSLSSPVMFVGIVLVTIFTILRYYSDVEFRLSLEYKKFCLFYVLIAVGYVVGYVLFPLHKNWIIIILIGEVAAVLYVLWKGHIFRGDTFKISSCAKQNWTLMGTLALTYIMSDFVSYADRMLLPFFGEAGDSYVFYAATLIGKIIALITTPLNGVIVGYLAKYDKKFTMKLFTTIIMGILGVVVIVTIGSVLVSHVFVYVLYPELYDKAKDLFLVANASQVFFFVSNTMMVIVLRFAPEKYQLYFGTAYVLLFFVIVVPAVILWGLWGMAIGLLIINVLKFCMMSGMGMYYLHRNPTE